MADNVKIVCDRNSDRRGELCFIKAWDMVVGAIFILADVSLAKEKRSYLMNKCQPFSDEALPLFLTKAMPVLADKLQEMSRILRALKIGSEQSVQKSKNALENIILVLTSRIMNFFDPILQIEEDLFEASLTDPNNSYPNVKFDDCKDKINELLKKHIPQDEIQKLLVDLDAITELADHESRWKGLEPCKKAGGDAHFWSSLANEKGFFCFFLW